ncbi:restriction endonuclease subunit S [Streptomyces acidiscabies]|uniref:restriction endonuclease subunit S n=1 Tax=Streptomyces acidiscabies TaxID=42234 RepID=UPI00095B9C91|nr:restriction endonuclease subunit S [Streptomyces acidiscabies]GAV44645.1 EcoKI restriction-modification system protein [Streptomyces acidiscabies]
MSSRIGVPNLAEWREKRLIDVCKLISRGTAPVYVDDSTIFAIGQRCVRTTGFESNFARPHSHKVKNILRAEHGDVLLNSTGTGTIGRSCIFNGDGDYMVDGHVTVLRADSSKVDPRWIEAMLRSRWGQQHLESHCFTGSTNQIELSRSDLLETSVPVPDLDEQRRIANILDAVDEKIEIATLEASKLRLLRSGVLRHAMRTGLELIGSVEASRLREIDGSTADDWSAIRLGSLVSRIEAGNSPDLEDRPATNGEWGVLKVSAVGRDGFRPAENKVAPRPELQHESLCVKAGDLIMTRANTADLVGLSCIAEETSSKLMLSDKTLRLVIDDRKASAEFVDLALEMDELRTQIQIAATGTSASMKNISQSSIQALVVPYSAMEMERICRLDAAHRKLLSVQQEELLRLRDLKQGLTEDLLTGRVRV